MKQLTTIAALVYLFATTSCNTKPIVHKSDYQKFLTPNNSELVNIDNEIKFWNSKLIESPDHTGAQLKTASQLVKRFQYSGNINEIIKADSFYTEANKLQKYFSSSTYRSLAANAVTQHKFKNAKLYLDSAAKLGDNLALTILQQVDVNIELGNLYKAQKLLKRYPKQLSTEALIRQAKILDHEGKLEEAIETLETALAKTNAVHDETNYIWLMSNLGDFYSHANNFTKAYQAYLHVLNINPAYYHCLRGIAWLAFSHDKNTIAAKEIINFLKLQHPVPDYDLLLAEINDFENNEAEKQNNITKFIAKTSNKNYGDMYNKYLFNLYADELNDLSKAMQLAEIEVHNRPTAESYHLLSWANFKKGNYKEALQITNNYVIEKCFEPDAAYHIATILQANGETKKAAKYFKEVNNSLFELGPAFAKSIN